MTTTITCEYCGSQVPIGRLTCPGCSAPVLKQQPQAELDIDALLEAVDVGELLRWSSAIIVNRHHANRITFSDLVGMTEHFSSPREMNSSAWIIAFTAMGDLMAACDAHGTRVFWPGLLLPATLLGHRLYWSEKCAQSGQPGDVALVDWRVYHRLDGGWPDEPLVQGGYQVSPFVVLGEAWQ